MSNTGPFNSGPRLGAVEGDPSRQAVASLRGYAYQLYATSIAWLDLREDGELYVEVAEDYAVVLGEALNAVQAKDTQASITINSDGVREAINGFVDLVRRNPGRQVSSRYLTTAAITAEKAAKDRAAPSGTLNYWRKAAAGADIAPLRRILLDAPLDDETLDFIRELDEPRFRSEFLRRIHWDGGSAPINGLRADLADRLASIGGELGVPPSEMAPLSGLVLQEVLATATRTAAPRRLTRGALLRLIEQATRVSVSRVLFDSILAALTAGGPAPNMAGDARVIETINDLPFPPLMSQRDALVSDVRAILVKQGVVFLSGATGMGKTMVARLAAKAHGGSWGLIDFRNMQPAAAIARLAKVSVETGADFVGLILDDLNQCDDLDVQRALARMRQRVLAHDVLCIVTSHRQPPNRLYAELGVPPDVLSAVPYLSESEVVDMVGQAGGDAQKWGATIRAAAGFGHPQLVQAIVSGLQSRAWPMNELNALERFEATEEAEIEKLAARRLIAAAPDDAKSMAYRLSIVLGRFDRSLALAVGGVAPAINKPGEQLDGLIGPWIDRVSAKALRVSPLLSGAGAEVLSVTEQQAVHRTIAEAVTAGPAMEMIKADIAFLHGVSGNASGPLMRLAYNILLADDRTRYALATLTFGIRFFSTEKPILPSDPRVSAIMRLAQCLLLASAGERDQLQASWRALLKDLHAIADLEKRTGLEYLSLSKLLLDRAVAGALKDWVSLLLRFDELTQANASYREFAAAASQEPMNGRSFSLTGFLFLNQASGLAGVAALASVFDALDALQPEQRNRLIGDCVAHPDDFTQILNHAWLVEHTAETIDGKRYAELYDRMARQALKWNTPAVAARCFVAKSIMLDEYADDDTGALASLSDAIKLCGPDWVLSRARAKILYRRRDHQGALELMRQIAEASHEHGGVEQAFLMREAAISAAELGHFTEAESWFDQARDAAASVGSDKMDAMAAGLRADAASAACNDGRTTDALVKLALSLEEIEAIAPSSSLQAEYTHRVIRHAILWFTEKIAPRGYLVDDDAPMLPPGACSNPEPRPEITSKPVGSVYLAWYMLAELDLRAGGHAGLDAKLQTLLEGRLSPPLEYGVRVARLALAMQRHDAKAFREALEPYLEIEFHWREHSALLKEMDPLLPNFGTVPAIPQEKRASVIPSLRRAGSLFYLSAALAGDGGSIGPLDDAPIDGADDLASANGVPKADDYAVEIVAQARLVLARDDLDPTEIAIAGLRFVDAVVNSDFKAHLSGDLAAWLRAHWRRIINVQRFRLRQPMVTVPPIEAALDESLSDAPFCARLALLAVDATGVPLATEFRVALNAWSVRNTVPASGLG